MNNIERQKEYEQKRIAVIKKSFSLDKVLVNANNPGWCHLSDEIIYLTLEIQELKNEIKKLRKKTKKVIEDE